MSGTAMQIFNRSLLVVAPLLLISCNKADDQKASNTDMTASTNPDNDGKVECALKGSNDFTRSCDKEWIVGANGRTLVIRHPDGGFRRFNVLDDGRGLVAAEGAEKASITTLENDMIEVSVAGDRYHLLAKIKPSVPVSSPAPVNTEKMAGDNTGG